MPERRSSYSPSKSTGEVRSSAESKSRKHSTRSPSPLISKSRQRSPPSPSRRLRRPIDRRSELVRSSSCGDLPSSATRMQTRVIIEQFVRHLTRIRTISKQIRTGDPDSYRLWTDLETSLASALTYANEDIQYQLSLQPLRDELVELRRSENPFPFSIEMIDRLLLFRQMQSTNAHLRQFVPPPPPVGYSQLLVRNQELQSQCDLLQDKLDSLERTNIRLIQRWTQQVTRLSSSKSSICLFEGSAFVGRTFGWFVQWDSFSSSRRDLFVEREIVSCLRWLGDLVQSESSVGDHSSRPETTAEVRRRRIEGSKESKFV